MRITNNITLKPEFNQNKKVSFKKAPGNAVDLLNSAVDAAKDAVKVIKKDLPKEEDSKLTRFFEGFTKFIANTSGFKWLASKGIDGLAYAVVIGNAAKEAMGTTIYTVQALTNEDLPPDKRKFVGMYDLAVGLMSTTFSLVVGIAMVKGQSALIRKVIGGDKAKTLPGYAKAFAGLTFILPVVVQTIIGKRIIAPAIAVPIAGRLKKDLEDKEALKKNGGEKPQEEMSPFPAEALILAKTQPNDQQNSFKQKFITNG